MAKAMNNDSGGKGARKVQWKSTTQEKARQKSRRRQADNRCSTPRSPPRMRPDIWPPVFQVKPPAERPPTPKAPSSKTFKQNLSKPHLSSLDNLLDKSAPAENKKSSLPFGGGKQVAHNQTFGARYPQRRAPPNAGMNDRP